MSFDNYFSHETGLLSTWDGENYDEGDGAQKTGLLRFGRWLKYRKDKDQLVREQAKFEQEMDMLECLTKKGWYIRSPSLARRWWCNPRCFSRDQHRSLVIAAGAMKQQRRLWRILWEHLKRGTLHQNNRKIDDLDAWKMPDVTSPDNMGEIIRALYMSGAKWLIVLWPLMLIADLSALVGLLLSFPQWKNPDHADDDNAIMSYLQAKYAMPTPISYLVRKIYKRYRPMAGIYKVDPPPAPDSYELSWDDMSKLTGAHSAIYWKHRPMTGAPPFFSLYKDILTKEL